MENFTWSNDMRRELIISLGVAVSVTMMVVVLLRQSRVATLEAERAQILAQLADPAKVSPTVAPADSPDFNQNSRSPSIELLQLRAEVTRLGSRKRELANARLDNNRLHSELTARGTNVPGAAALPVGYIRKSQARNLGYHTPDATFETVLWAIQNRDSSAFLKAINPEIVKQFETRMQSPSSTEEFFKEADSWLGMHVVGSEAGADGEVVLMVEIEPSMPSPERFRFKQFGGQWKLVEGL